MSSQARTPAPPSSFVESPPSALLAPPPPPLKRGRGTSASQGSARCCFLFRS
jgi:hypothetical protein